jgi:hypothetical protein
MHRTRSKTWGEPRLDERSPESVMREELTGAGTGAGSDRHDVTNHQC